MMGSPHDLGVGKIAFARDREGVLIKNAMLLERLVAFPLNSVGQEWALVTISEQGGAVNCTHGFLPCKKSSIIGNNCSTERAPKSRRQAAC